VWLRVGLICAGTSLALVLAPAAAAAQSTAPADAPVSIRVDPCVPVDHASLQKLLAIELGTSTAHEPGPQVPTRVWVGCSPLGIELRLEDGMTSKMMARTLPASSFRDASSTRLLALAVAEFVVASWIELRVQPEPAVQPVPVAPTPSPAQREQVQVALHERGADPASSGVSVSAALALALWPSNESLWLGAGVRIAREASPTIAWAIAFDFTGTTEDVELGKVDGLSGSVAFSALLYLRVKPVILFTGPGARVGVVRLAGDPDDDLETTGDDFAAPFGGPIWVARADFVLSRKVRLGLELEAGVTTLPAKATGDGGNDVFAVEGVWLSPALSLGASF
jgi:hypothetical protein